MLNNSLSVNNSNAELIEKAVIIGDLSKLTPSERVNYYKVVCSSLGLNPFTKPFEYITLNNKLTLYAKKDATDQLRSIQGVSIDDVDIQETPTQFIVKVKGHNRDNRQDVEVGVVNKSDMQGNLANAQMKAVTKGKRRLTLSLCGLGWLDETEIETIKDAKPVVVVQETGEIVDGLPKEPTAMPISITDAIETRNRDGVPYGNIPTEKLNFMLNAASKANNLSDDQLWKIEAMKMILKSRADGTIKEPETLVDTTVNLGGEEQ